MYSKQFTLSNPLDITQYFMRLKIFIARTASKAPYLLELGLWHHFKLLNILIWGAFFVKLRAEKTSNFQVPCPHYAKNSDSKINEFGEINIPEICSILFCFENNFELNIVLIIVLATICIKFTVFYQKLIEFHLLI